MLKPSWAYVFDVRAGREAALEPFRRMRTFVPLEDRRSSRTSRASSPTSWSWTRSSRLQGVLRRWLWIHVPPAGLLMGLVVVHVFAWIWY